jgi:O-methyltransferase
MKFTQRIENHFLYGRLARLVQSYTLVGPERILNLCRLARRIESEKIPGDVIECGVCDGGTAAILADYATRSRLQRTVWLLDSFQGMPEATTEDGEAAKAHIEKEVGDPIRVNKVLKFVRAKMERVKIVPGWFQDTFPVVSPAQIALLNIDAHWFQKK